MDTADVEKYCKDGYLVLENFVSNEDVEAMRKECYTLVEDMNPAEHQTVFSTVRQSHRNDYFINSADRIGFFFEEGAMSDAGELKVDKHRSLNKIGHALHQLCPAFKKVTFGDKVKGIAKSLEFTEPIVCQSMYIFKQPRIGGKVVPHQDASYLHAATNVEAGIWIALEDATLENGCLWFIPGSHKGGLYGNYRMVRTNSEEGETCKYIGTKPDYNALGEWVAAPIKKGDAILIDGYVVHKSETNHSEKSRHIYTFHMFDQGRGKWNEENWIQPTEQGTFMPLYDH